MFVTVRVEWDMGHRLADHDGPCRNLHGHRYVADLMVAGSPCDEPGTRYEGMVADFAHIKAALSCEAAKLDHRFLLCDRDPLLGAMSGLPGVVIVPFVPTAENLAAALLRACQAGVDSVMPDVRVVAVRLHETPTSWAEAVP